MNFKILCSDLDGTLLTTKSDVSNTTISEIARIRKKIKIILVSARMPSGMHYLQKRLGIEDQPIICYNGALVLDGKKELLSVYIPLHTVRQIYEICKEFKTDIGLYENDHWQVTRSSERVEKEIKYTRTYPSFVPAEMTLEYLEKNKIGAHKLMLMGTKESSDELMPVLRQQFGTALHVYRSNDTLIEVAPKSVSKLTAIQQLLTKEETLRDIIAFGDNYNDMDMLTHVACGVAVGNAREEVKHIADHVTLKNTQDGVAHFIREHLLI
jgi:Cof subfamily protein (haloacid dehalogenase superfamily)